jgi:hypothetical protein
VDPTGNVYVSEGSTGASGYLDYATLKYSATGSQLWVARYDGPRGGDDDTKGLAVDSSGNAIVTGYSLGAATGYDYATIKYNTSGNQIWLPDTMARRKPTIRLRQSHSISVGNVYVTGGQPGHRHKRRLRND